MSRQTTDKIKTVETLKREINLSETASLLASELKDDKVKHGVEYMESWSLCCIYEIDTYKIHLV